MNDEQATELNESAEDLYESAPCGFLSTTPAGMIVKVNRTFLDWTGFTREDLVGTMRVQDLLTMGGRIFYETHLSPLLDMQGHVREIALDLRSKHGEVLPMFVNANQKRRADGQPLVRRFCALHAIDRRDFERELIAARKKAEQAAQAKADFISMVSHEIRTPLTAILGVGHLLENTQPSEQQQKFLRILRSSSESLLALINDVLDFSKIEAGRLALQERPFDVREVVYGMAHSLGVKADEKSLALRVDIDEAVPQRVLGDALKLRQVLTNLVGNAIKFTQKGGVDVVVRSLAIDRERVALHFRITDTGIGIAPEHIAHIFEEFTQASLETGAKFGGTGLGLAICRKLVELFGSKMEVESAPGSGSSFGFRLDLRIAPHDAPQADTDDDAPRLDGVRALLVDDNEVNIFVLGGFLRRWGVVYDVASNGHQAIERVRAGEYDIVLMDLRMPELDGYSATRTIRDLPGERFRTLPIIATSASVRIGQKRRLQDAGFSDFLGKPVSPDALHRLLTRSVRR